MTSPLRTCTLKAAAYVFGPVSTREVASLTVRGRANHSAETDFPTLTFALAVDASKEATPEWANLAFALAGGKKKTNTRVGPGPLLSSRMYLLEHGLSSQLRKVGTPRILLQSLVEYILLDGLQVSLVNLTNTVLPYLWRDGSF
jgi:hypothetical protein